MQNRKAMGRGSRIQSVERASEILGYFRVNRPQLTLPEITARSGLTRATAHRYVSVLHDLGFLRFDPVSSSYSLGPRILMLAAAASAGQPMIRIAGPYMEELVRATNETAVLSVWDGSAPVVVRVDDNPDRIIRLSVTTGVRLLPWGSAQGRVFGAFLPEDQLPGIPSTVERESLRSSIDEVRRTRLAINTNESEGTRTVAAPIFSNSDIPSTWRRVALEGAIVGSLGLVGTEASIPDGRDSTLAQALLTTANRLSAELGQVELEQ